MVAVPTQLYLQHDDLYVTIQLLQPACGAVVVVFGRNIRQFCDECHQLLPASSRHLHLLLLQVGFFTVSVYSRHTAACSEYTVNTYIITTRPLRVALFSALSVYVFECLFVCLFVCLSTR